MSFLNNILYYILYNTLSIYDLHYYSMILLDFMTILLYCCITPLFQMCTPTSTTRSRLTLIRLWRNTYRVSRLPWERMLSPLRIPLPLSLPPQLRTYLTPNQKTLLHHRIQRYCRCQVKQESSKVFNSF